MKKINFILPATNDTPIGGYKTVYQYANELSKRNYEVTINFLYEVVPKVKHPIYQHTKKLVRKVLGREMPATKITWFDLHDSVRLNFNVIDLTDVPDGDIVVATSAPTAYFVKALSGSKGRKFYYIQGLETWWYGGNLAKLQETYRLGLKNLAISRDLYKIVDESAQSTPYYLPNFFDSSEFYVTRAMTKRDNVVALLNHRQKSKRTRFGLHVLSEVKKQVPDLKVELFGSSDVDFQLPDYVNFTHHANIGQLRDQIYGQSKIYLMPSTSEGWGLTGTEAMACGATLVASDIGGIKDYACQKNSVLLNPNDESAFINNIIELLKDDILCQQLAIAGNRSVQSFTIQKATDRLLDAFYE